MVLSRISQSILTLRRGPMKIRKICGVIVALAIGVSGVPIAQAAPSLPSLPQQAPTLPPLPQMPPLPAAPINLQPKPQVNQNVRETYLSFGDSVAANPTALDVAVYKTKKNVPNLEWPTIRNGSCDRILTTLQFRLRSVLACA